MPRRRSRRTHAVIVGVEVGGDHRLVLGERLLQVAKGVARDAKRCALDVGRERVEPEGGRTPRIRLSFARCGVRPNDRLRRGQADVLLRVQEHLRKLLVPEHLLEDHARVERDVLVLVPVR
jgi:hypothetical protein